MGSCLVKPDVLMLNILANSGNLLTLICMKVKVGVVYRLEYSYQSSLL